MVSKSGEYRTVATPDVVDAAGIVRTSFHEFPSKVHNLATYSKNVPLACCVNKNNLV